MLRNMRQLHVIRTKTHEHSSRTVQTSVTINIIKNKWRLLLLVLCALCPACFTCFCAAAHLIAINSSLSGWLRRWRSASGALECRNIPDTQAGQVVLGRCVSLGANTATHAGLQITRVRRSLSCAETQVWHGHKCRPREKDFFISFCLQHIQSVTFDVSMLPC